MKDKKIFFMTSMPIILAMCSIFTVCDTAGAAARVAVRGTAATSRKSVTANVQKIETVEEEVIEDTTEEEPVIINKSNQFENVVDEILEESSSDNSFAEEIRKQRAAISARESENAAKDSLNNAIRSGTNTCDLSLRKCMIATCGNDFTKCALDGDTDFGDKLNKCKRETTCSATEFSSFSKEIKDDRDMNARLASYEKVINCGNQYNACIVNACGTTYGKCLGKKNADAAIEKCKTIATNCTEADSGLTSRFGTAIGKLRESAESEIVADEKKLYELRDSMSKACKSLGAMFDERSFDCVYTVNFFAGENQDTPMASRKGYAGDTFTCMQEWFGINATTFKENAYRETRSQTAASSAMLGAGLGTATGLITSGAIGRALETQKAKKELKKECNSQGGKLKKGECVKKGDARYDDGSPEDPDEDEATETSQNTNTPSTEKKHLKGTVCTDAKEHHLLATYDEGGKCIVKSCVAGYKPAQNNLSCVKDETFGKKKGMVCTAEYNKAHPNAKVALAVYNDDGKCVISESEKNIKNDIDNKKAACTAPKIWKAGSCWCPNGLPVPKSGQCK